MTALAEQVTEKQLQDTVVRMAKLLGWLVYHTYDSRRSEPGFPDLVLTHPDHGTVFMELKREKGRVSKYQHRWMETLAASGERVYLVRPSDMDTVESVLRGES